MAKAWKYNYNDSNLLSVSYRTPNEVYFQARLHGGQLVTVSVSGFTDNEVIREAIRTFAPPDELEGLTREDHAVTVHLSRHGSVVFPKGTINEI